MNNQKIFYKALAKSRFLNIQGLSFLNEPLQPWGIQDRALVAKHLKSEDFYSFNLTTTPYSQYTCRALFAKHLKNCSSGCSTIVTKIFGDLVSSLHLYNL